MATRHSRRFDPAGRIPGGWRPVERQCIEYHAVAPGAEAGNPVAPQDVYVHSQAGQIPKWQKWAHQAREQLAELLATDAA